jgi:drug/metabolite transporter (DMT)-like permease
MSKPATSKRWLPQYLILSLVWGASFAFTEAGLTITSPLGITATRHAIGALVLLVLLIVTGRFILLRQAPAVLWKRMILVAMLLNVIPGYLFAFAQNHISTVIASIINSATPILTVLMLLLVFKTEPVTRKQVVGIMIGLAGGIIALGIEPGDLGDNDPIGVFAVIGAILCYGFAIPYVRKSITPLSDSALMLATMQVAIAGAITVSLFAVTVVLGGQGLEAPSAWIGTQVLILGFGTGIAYVWHFQLIERAGSAVASTITYPTLLVSLVIGWIVLRETFGWEMVIGAVLIVIGSAVTQQRQGLAKQQR